ncbi:MAG: plastocyanin/azurin family copper-binding protein [Chitinophagales bacterium]
MKPTVTLFSVLIQLVLIIASYNFAYSQDLIDIEVGSNYFDPDSVTINVGDTVRWTNVSGSHNVNGTTGSYPSNPESFGNSVGSGWTYTFVFSIAGNYDYHCDPHLFAGMTGVITVLAPATPSEIDSVTADVNDVCPETSVTLTAHGVVEGDGATLTWYDGPGGNGNNLDTTNPLVVNPGATTTYYARLDGSANTVEDSVTVNVLPKDDASFSYSSGFFCLTGSDPTPTINGTSGGVFSGDNNLSINSTTGEIDLQASGAGNYEVMYRTLGVCPDTAYFDIVINTTPDAGFSYTGSPFCGGPGAGIATITLDSGASAGNFSSSAGLIIDAATGTVNISSSALGTYIVTNEIVASGGCPAASASDTIVIAQIYSLAEDVSICQGESYTFPDGNIGMTDSVYTSLLTSSMGCDSTITTTLTVEQIDKTVNMNNITATANETGATYQWLDCDNNTEIQGETGQAFTASTSGNYAVAINKNNCSDTSDCVNITVIGIDENTLIEKIAVYPNPSSGDFVLEVKDISGNIHYEVTDLSGKVILPQIQVQQKNTSVSLDAAAGLYFLNIYSKNGRTSFKLLVK